VFRWVLVVGAVAICASLFADRPEVIGEVRDGYGRAELKDPLPTSDWIRYRPDWVRCEILAGTQIRTIEGENSFMKVLLNDGSRVSIHPGSLLTLDREDETLVMKTDQARLDIVRAGGATVVVTAHGRLLPECGAKVLVFVSDDTLQVECSKDADKGATLETTQGVKAVLSSGARLWLRMNPADKTYSFEVDKRTEGKVQITGGEKSEEFGASAVVELLGGGDFKVKEKGAVPQKFRPLPPVALKDAKIGLNVVARGGYYENDNDYNYYRGGMDQFDLLKAEALLQAGVGDYALFRVSLDGNEQKPLKEGWLELFLPKSPDLVRFRFGQMRTPFGYQVQKPLEELPLLTYSMSTRWGFTGLRAAPDSEDPDLRFDLGFMFHGWLLGDAVHTDRLGVHYQLGLFNGTGRNRSEDNSEKTFSGTMTIRLAGWLGVGGAYYDGSTGRDASLYHRRRRGGFLTVHTDAFVMTFEYILATDDPRVGKRGNDSEGFCVETGVSLGLISRSLKPLWLVARYEVFNPAKNSISGVPLDRWEKVFSQCVALRWNVDSRVSVVLAWEKIDQDETRYPVGVEVGEADENFLFLISFRYF